MWTTGPLPTMLALALASMLLGACEAPSGKGSGAGAQPSVRERQASGPAAPSSAPPATAAPGPGTATLRRIKTVFVVLMENKAWSEVKGSPDAPYLNGELLPKASIAAAYRGALGGNLHPSEPNYIWLEAGSNLGISDDDGPAANHRSVTDHLVTLLDKGGVSWRAYQEDIAGDVCPLTPIGQYMPKHNPMIFFDDVTLGNDPSSRYCIEHMRPLAKTGRGSSFESDLAEKKVARYNFITPNQCNDMHSSCPPISNTTRQGDEWLAEWAPKILASDAYKNDGALFILWDEAQYAEHCESANCPIGMFVLSPLAKGGGYESHLPLDHSATLRTLQEIFGVKPFLRAAASATDLGDLFKP